MTFNDHMHLDFSKLLYYMYIVYKKGRIPWITCKDKVFEENIKYKSCKA